MKRKNALKLTMFCATAFALSVFSIQGVTQTGELERTLSLSYESDIVLQQGSAQVTLADVVAVIDSRLGSDERVTLLTDASRLGSILKGLVIDEWALVQAEERGLLDDPQLNAQIRLAAVVAIRNHFRSQYLEEHQLDSYEALARELYLTRPEQFRSPERHDFEHILVTVGPHRSETEAMTLILGAHQRLTDGEAFTVVADALSEDTIAATQNHRYEEANLSDVVGPLANAMQEVGIGEVSVPVRSQFGWHIGRIVEVRPREILSWEEAKPNALDMARRNHLTSVWNRALRSAQADPAMFAEGAVRSILDHYGLEGLGRFNEATLVEEMEP